MNQINCFNVIHIMYAIDSYYVCNRFILCMQSIHIMYAIDSYSDKIHLLIISNDCITQSNF